MTDQIVTGGQTPGKDPLNLAFDAGQRAGLASAALAQSIVAFFSLLGAEKAILAIVLACYALRGSRQGSAGRRLATVAIGMASVFLVTIVLVLILFWNELAGLVEHLRHLS